MTENPELQECRKASKVNTNSREISYNRIKTVLKFENRIDFFCRSQV